MSSQVKKFLDKLESDNDFKRRFETGSNQEKDNMARPFANGMDFVAFKKELFKSLTKDGSLDSESLSKVAGGGSIGQWIGETIGGLIGGNKDLGGGIGDKAGDLVCTFLKM